MRQEIKSNWTHGNHAVTNVSTVCVFVCVNCIKSKYVFLDRKEALQQTLAGTQTLKLWVRPLQGMRWRHVTTPSFVPLSLPTSCLPSLPLSLSRSPLRLLPLRVTWQPWNRCTSPDRVQVARPFNGTWQRSSRFPVMLQKSFINTELKDSQWRRDSICRAQAVYS